MRFNLFICAALTGWMVFIAAGYSHAQAPLVINAGSGQDSSWMDKEIPSVVLGRKKFKLSRRLYQNLITRFNAYYNAHTKLSRIVEAADARHVNDYDSLLTLFPHIPADFQGLQRNLDSVIYDASYGIEIHDPRSKWIDNLYLIAGQAYFYQGDYLNAVAAFKYIVKNKGEKDEEGRPRIIGTRSYTPQEQISIATPEKKKLFYHKPSRNDAFIWLIHSYIDSGAYDLASNLISTLKADPGFPARLHTALLTQQAWFYFRQGLIAQGIPFMERGVDSLEDKRMQARWQFLLGQYYQQQGSWTLAQAHFEKVTHLPSDPMMRFYAYLKMTEMQILEKKEDFKTGSAPLLAMARKEKYARYRSIIYYNLGRMALKSSLASEATQYFLKSLRYNRENTAQTLLSAHLLADTYFRTGAYREARRYYDSTALAMDPGAPDYPTITLRRDALAGVVTQLDIIERQDSLQQLAAMPREQLTALLNQIVEDSARARRKRNLILKEPAVRRGVVAGLTGNKQPEADEPGNSPQDWYFYNPSLKAKGFTLFQSQWGKRKLQDNWRTQNGSSPMAAATSPATAADSSGKAATQGNGSDETTLESLLASIPLDTAAMKVSNDSIQDAIYREATIFDDQLAMDTVALHLLGELSTRFPDNPYQAETAYRLSLIYRQLGDGPRATQFQNLVATRYSSTKFAEALRTPVDTAAPMERLITGIYDAAYLAYLGGEYDRAALLKDSAMRIYPRNKQKGRFDLLGAMVLLKQQSDSLGKIALQDITDKDSQDTAIAEQARAILGALTRKQELVEHLVQLQLPETEEDTVAAAPQPAVQTAAQVNPAPQAPPVATIPQTAAPQPAAKDTVKTAPPPPPKTPYKLAAQEPHFVVLAFTHTDKRYIDESLNRFSAYNQKNHQADKVEVSSYLLGRNQVVLIFRLFPNEVAALKYYQEIRSKAPQSIIPDIPTGYYRLFIISRDNFILLNNTKDYNGYLEFFSRNYR